MEIQLDKSKKYLLAASYGPDSMALLSLLLKGGYRFEIAHVNYHVREPEADEESTALFRYAKANEITFHRLDVDGKAFIGNFEAQARRVRYHFFSQIIKQDSELYAVLTAHHQDDLLETYLMQTKRQNYLSYYGIKIETIIDGVRVMRPLLAFSKKDLFDYDLVNKIPFAIDKSNFDLRYTRNYIRHKVVAKMTSPEKEKLIDTINQLNQQRQQEFLLAKEQLIDGHKYSIKALLKLTEEQKSSFLYFLLAKYELEKKFSSKLMRQLENFIVSRKPNVRRCLLNDYYLAKEYDYVLIYRDSELKPYAYTIEKPGEYHFPQLNVNFDSLDKRLQFPSSSYPLTIRSIRSNDFYYIGNKRKSVKRLFIDWKVPYHLRLQWPLFVDCKGKVIFIPRFRSQYSEKSNSTLDVLLN